MGTGSTAANPNRAKDYCPSHKCHNEVLFRRPTPAGVFIVCPIQAASAEREALQQAPFDTKLSVWKSEEALAEASRDVMSHSRDFVPRLWRNSGKWIRPIRRPVSMGRFGFPRLMCC